MKPPRQGSLLLGAVVLTALVAPPIAAQSTTPSPVAAETTVQAGDASPGQVDVSLELLGVMIATLVPDGTPGSGDGTTRTLLASLALDPLVSDLLEALGARALPGGPPAVVTPQALARLQESLAGGVPGWLTEAVQVSVDLELPLVLPLNVLLVLARDPDEATAEFLRVHGVEAPTVAAATLDVLESIGS